jgi:hypothetical protein
LLENKRVEFFAMPKSAEEYEKKELERSGSVGSRELRSRTELWGDTRQLGPVEIAHDAVAVDAGQ